MSKTDDESLKSAEQAFIAQVLEGVCVETLPEVLEGAEVRLGVREGLRNKALELFADSVFYKAAARLVELMDDEDPKVAIQAAAKLVDLRRDVYKTQSARKQTKAVLGKLFDDGFDF